MKNDKSEDNSAPEVILEVKAGRPLYHCIAFEAS